MYTYIYIYIQYIYIDICTKYDLSLQIYYDDVMFTRFLPHKKMSLASPQFSFLRLILPPEEEEFSEVTSEIKLLGLSIGEKNNYPPVIKHRSVMFLLIPPFIGDFPLPCLITREYPRCSMYGLFTYMCHKTE